jgi:hypothetical protein
MLLSEFSEGVFRRDGLLGGVVGERPRDGPAFAEILRKEEELSRDARGVGLLRLHSSLRSVPRPLVRSIAHGNGAREVDGCEDF